MILAFLMLVGLSPTPEPYLRLPVFESYLSFNSEDCRMSIQWDFRSANMQPLGVIWPPVIETRWKYVPSKEKP